MARVRAHEWPDDAGNDTPCPHCGQPFAQAMARELLCVFRDVPDDAPRPEPARRTLAHESWDDIAARAMEIRQYEEGWCWKDLGRPVSECWCWQSGEGGATQPCEAARARPAP